MRLKAQFGVLLMLASLPVCATVAVEHGTNLLPRLFLQKTLVAQTGGSNNNTPAPTQDGRQPGKWLQKYRDLPPDQRLKALENDPDFKKLGPQLQQALRERLQKYNSLPQDEQDRRAKWIEVIGSLPPAQREKIRQSVKQLQDLPDDRKPVIRKAVKDLSEMSEQQRNEILQSDRFKQTFSEGERGIIVNLASVRALMQQQQEQQRSTRVGSGAPAQK